MGTKGIPKSLEMDPGELGDAVFSAATGFRHQLRHRRNLRKRQLHRQPDVHAHRHRRVSQRHLPLRLCRHLSRRQRPRVRTRHPRVGHAQRRPAAPIAYFTDNGDGTVYDAQTFLTWQKVEGSTTYIWSSGLACCKSLSLGGKSDWRLPTVAEITTLRDISTYSPATSVPFTTSTSSTTSYWTAVPWAGGSSGAWAFKFDSGFSFVSQNPGTTGYRARCVRSAVSPVTTVSTRFSTDSVAGTTVDNVTKKTWQWNVSSSNVSLANATSQCASLSLNGLSWHLPNAIELESIIDRSAYPTAINTASFTGSPVSGIYWASTLDASAASLAWYIDFASGAGNSQYTTNTARFRCVH